MIYTTLKANLIAEQLRKFTSGYSHHLAGQFGNIDFWLNEVIAALKAIDEHRKRFKSMYEAQKHWVKLHDTVVHEYCPICQGICEFSNGVPSLPQLKYKTEKKEARKELVNSTYYFLIRCYKIGLLNEDDINNTFSITPFMREVWERVKTNFI